jgi:hypothetical protein
MQFSKNQVSPSNEIGARPTGQPRNRHWGRFLSCLVATAALSGFAQSTRSPPPRDPNWTMIPRSANPVPDANAQMRMHEDNAKQQNFEAANAERKKQIADDSAKLLKLATDLKTEVDKTSKDTLSLNVIRKADEIERLAHNVKEKMKLTVGTN